MKHEHLTVRIADKCEMPLMANLLQYYIYDFSEFATEEISDEGVFSYPYLKNYWQDPNRTPYLFYLQSNKKNEPVGFAMVRREADPVTGEIKTDMAEFFILRSCRRFRLGSTAAAIVWNLHPGTWTVRVLRGNYAAFKFWQPLIIDLTKGDYLETSTGTEFLFEFVLP